MFVEPVLKQMTLQRVAVDIVGVVGVLVCLCFSLEIKQVLIYHESSLTRCKDHRLRPLQPPRPPTPPHPWSILGLRDTMGATLPRPQR